MSGPSVETPRDPDGDDLLCLDEVFEDAIDPNTGEEVTLMKVLANPLPKEAVLGGERIPTSDLAVKEVMVLTKAPRDPQWYEALGGSDVGVLQDCGLGVSDLF